MTTIEKLRQSPFKDSKGKIIELGDKFILPDPKVDDLWCYGGCIVTVEDWHSSTVTGEHFLIVKDADDDIYCIEPERVTIITE